MGECRKMNSNCEYHDDGCWVRPCEHKKENCALYLDTEQYNAKHQLHITPCERAVAMLENHHYDQFQEAVVLVSMGLLAEGRKTNWLEVIASEGD